MAESVAEVLTQPQSVITDSPFTQTFSLFNSFGNTATKHKPLLSKKSNSQAVAFKYKTSSNRYDIDQIRQLLTIERLEHENDEEFDFYLPDYERLMTDDWLVTRFLLRAVKAIKKQPMFIKDNVDENDSSTINERDDSIYEKTMELIQTCARFRYEFRINGLTEEREFPLEWTSVNGLFCYRQDLVGNPTVYLRVALHRPKLIETDELRYQFKRYMLYTLEKSDQKLNNNPGKAICCVFDMTNAAFDNIDLELTSWMIKSFKDCSPKLLCYVLIYNPPWFFMATFKLICGTLLSNSKKQSVKFAHGNEILDYIDYKNLPLYMKSTIR